MRKKLLVFALAIAALSFAATAATAIPLPQDMSGYYKFGYTDGYTYAVRVDMGVGAIHCYILPGNGEHHLGVIVGNEIYFDSPDDESKWGVLTQIDANTSLITVHDADEGVTDEFTVIRITEDEADEIAKKTEAEWDNNSCVNNLKQLGLVLHMFAQENGNEMPISLAETYPEYAVNRGIFVCPARGGAFRDYDYDYEYIPGFYLGAPNPDQEPILIERKGNHTTPTDAYHVLYLDGHVERHKE